jgi:hypothetical protein
MIYFEKKKCGVLVKSGGILVKSGGVMVKSGGNVGNGGSTLFFLKINHYKKNILCDSNVYKCLPTIHFCSNILFLFYYI